MCFDPWSVSSPAAIRLQGVALAIRCLVLPLDSGSVLARQMLATRQRQKITTSRPFIIKVSVDRAFLPIQLIELNNTRSICCFVVSRFISKLWASLCRCRLPESCSRQTSRSEFVMCCMLDCCHSLQCTIELHQCCVASLLNSFDVRTFVMHRFLAKAKHKQLSPRYGWLPTLTLMTHVWSVTPSLREIIAADFFSNIPGS